MRLNFRAGHITPLITAYLNCDDVEGAVGAFESLAKTLKKLPGKRELMEYLIQVHWREIRCFLSSLFNLNF